MKTRLLGKNGIAVSSLGLGCMGMSEFYGSSNDLEHAFRQGITFYDTADTYGLGHNEELLARFMAEHRKEIVIATKFRHSPQQKCYERRIDTSPDYVQKACDASLQRLKTDVIDLYYAHRLNPIGWKIQ